MGRTRMAGNPRRYDGRNAPISVLRLLVIALAIWLAPWRAAPPQVNAQRRGSRGTIVGMRPCPLGSIFTCVALAVPRDHQIGERSGTTQVVFAQLPARDPARRRGTLVTIVGGPGASGIANADAYVDMYPAALRTAFDLVFFDIRGVGLSGNLRCDDAVATYLNSDSQSATPEQDRTAISLARTFAQTCSTRLGDASLLGTISTAQAVEDLEAYRVAIGAAQLWLYGESYGTQLAQLYAARYPQRVAAMVLDSPVDPGIDGPEFSALQARAFNATLVRTLNACDAQAMCHADFSEPALNAYDRLAAQLRVAPIPFIFHSADGRDIQRVLTFSALESVAATYLYAPADRAHFVRALAYASRGELQPLAMLSYVASGVTPDNLLPDPDPAYSDAAYYTINCNDYAYFSGAPNERARRYMKTGDAVDSSLARLHSVYYTDLPCAFWPGAASTRAAPATLYAENVPTLILTSDADPATPSAQSRALALRYRSSAAIVQSGGAHVLFARRDACIDEPVMRFLATGALPASRETHCAGEVLAVHVPLVKPALSDYTNLMDLFAAMEGELTHSAGYSAWSRALPHREACLLSGTQTVVYNVTDDADVFALTACTLTGGVALTGSGQRELSQDHFTLRVSLSGALTGTLDYTRDGSTRKLSGTANGKRITLTRGKQ
jgi:pimeloyl-ACP methyl ester carboxylesterase